MAENKNIPQPQGAAVIPEYLTSLYYRRYLDMTFSNFFDGQFIAGLSTFFQLKRLTALVLDEISEEGQRVLQMGVASGEFERQIAAKMDSKGVYHVEDISPIRLIACKNKLAPWLNTTFAEVDVCQPDPKRYDVVICFFLLHELPDTRKQDAVRRALESLLPGGKAIFVDYHRPAPLHPLRYFVKRANRLFEPFSETLWRREIEGFAKNSGKYSWTKRTIFGGMYQCVKAELSA